MNNEWKETIKQAILRYVKLKGSPGPENYDALDSQMLYLFDRLVLEMEVDERGTFSLEVLESLLPGTSLEELQEILNLDKDFTKLSEQREPKKDEVS